MDIISKRVADVPDGIELETSFDDASVTCYVVIGEPDLNAVAGIVPEHRFQEDAQIHATAVEGTAQAVDRIEEVLENMNPEDVAVFLCADRQAYDAALDVLGLENTLN